MLTRYAKPEDRQILLRMRCELWPNSMDEHPVAIDDYFKGAPTFVDKIVVCENDQGCLIGFAELRVRNYAEGSENMEVPYLEGWFIDSSYRGQGAGGLLIVAAEEWARSLGYSELASDAEIDNHGSIQAHLSLGFHEVERSVCFLMKL